MSDIPSELHDEILRRVPAESLLRFRAVCKSWRRLIDDPSFIRSHSQNQSSSTTLLIRNSIGTILCSLTLDSLNYNEAHQTVDVTPIKALFRSGVPDVPALPVASCNGLILDFYYGFYKTWLIWNPITREFHELPQFNTKLRLAGSGIGYDSASDDYKVVRIDYLRSRHDKTVYQTSVYSLKMDSWRIMKDCPYKLSSLRSLRGVFLNGALHWITFKNRIVAFVLGTEDYIELPLPESSRQHFIKHLDVLGGCLFLSCYDMTEIDGCELIEVWVMKDYGVEKSWMKLFSFRELGIDGASATATLWPVAYIKSKGYVILQHDDDFLWLDVENNSAKMVTVSGLPHNFSSQVVPGSLFRLDHGCAVGVKSGEEIETNTAHARVTHSVRITDV